MRSTFALRPGHRTRTRTRADRAPRPTRRSGRTRARLALIGAVLGAVLGLFPAAQSPAADDAKKPSPAFRDAMKRFLVAQNIPAQMGEQMAFSAAEQVLAPLAASGVAITEPMQALVLDEARKDFGKRYGDVDYLTDLYSDIYAQHFSEKEMKELADFWESPVARKLLAKSQVINEGFVAKLQETTTMQLGEFQSRVEKQLREAGILGSPSPTN
ncbi:MAG: DUF2059 domain-containing protein [Myxococcota bacterium]